MNENLSDTRTQCREQIADSCWRIAEEIKLTIMAIDHIIEKFDRPNNFQDEKSTMNNSSVTCITKTRKHCATFFASRWMGLLIGPMYGLFLYLYVTHLILSLNLWCRRFKSYEPIYYMYHVSEQIAICSIQDFTVTVLKHLLWHLPAYYVPNYMACD